MTGRHRNSEQTNYGLKNAIMNRIAGLIAFKSGLIYTIIKWKNNNTPTMQPYRWASANTFVFIGQYVNTNSRKYEVIHSNEYQLINQKALREFFKNGSLKPPSDEVYLSWTRCKSMGVNPNQISASMKISPDNLETLRQEHSTFLNISRPVMKSLYTFLSNEDFVVALSDDNGILLEVFGDEDLKNSVSKGNWRAGANWSEEKAGNNIIGTAIHLNKPVMIIGYEHYCRCSHHHAGAGAPVKNVDGKIIGAISVAGTVEKVHPHTLGMIVAAKQAIETQMEMHMAWKTADNARMQSETIINTVSEGLLVTDADNQITFCNHNASVVLHTNSERLIGRPLDLFLPESALKRFRNIEKGSLDNETVFKVDDSYVKCICSSKHILRDGSFQGLVLVLTACSRAERLANKLLNKDTYWSFENLIGGSQPMQQVVRAARKASSFDSCILLLGESGTGKDVFAQAIHNASARQMGPYVAVNCAALPNELISSELFGYTEGAFTGAKKGGSKGKVELANSGTLFLDEIGEMTLEQQAILLRLLENHTIQKIGSGKEDRVDVRIIAASNKDLLKEVNHKRFRSDLFYRLNVFTINIPTLRERKEDIRALAESFLDRLSERTGQPQKTIDEAALGSLMAYDWPGNIRELQNILERAWMLADGPSITEALLPALGLQTFPEESAKDYPPPVHVFVDARKITAAVLQDVLDKNSWNISKSCLELGISRPTMYRKISQFGLQRNQA